MKKERTETKTAKLTNLLSLFFTFSFCVVFIVEVYTVLVYTVYTVFFGKKEGGFEKSRLLGGYEKN